ncbi:MAG: hypothetical protein M3271_04020, partial [Actinomycetota bacterium]|nr:hypothetical protein [Actinomycetota bacterium]
IYERPATGGALVGGSVVHEPDAGGVRDSACGGVHVAKRAGRCSGEIDDIALLGAGIEADRLPGLRIGLAKPEAARIDRSRSGIPEGGSASDKRRDHERRHKKAGEDYDQRQLRAER